MTLVGILIAAAVLSLIGYLYKVKMRSRLSDALGRKVEDHELTSLNSWMDASPDKQKNFKKYTPPQSLVETRETEVTTDNDEA